MERAEFVDLMDAAIAADDLDALEALGEHFTEDKLQSAAFTPAIRLDGQDPDEEGGPGLGLANSWSREIRKRRYERKLRDGYSGPIIIDEGDSWFQFPALQHDTIDELSKTYAIRSLSAAGDTLANMVDDGEYARKISQEGADILLFSASGNDILGDGQLVQLLNRFDTGMGLSDVLNDDAISNALSDIETGYETMITTAKAANPNIQIFFHGYDKPIPRRRGQWLGRPMGSLDVPTSMQVDITGELIDRLNARMEVIAARHTAQVTHIDCRGVVGGTVQSWRDELHPKTPGYTQVANMFDAHIRDIDPAPRIFTGFEAFASGIGMPRVAAILDIDDTRDLDALIAEAEALEINAANAEEAAPPCAVMGSKWCDDEDIASAMEYKAFAESVDLTDSADRLRTRRALLNQEDEDAFERVIGRSNLFPVNFLGRGARIARAVAQVSPRSRAGTPLGPGSGFMVGPGLLITNNHVVGDLQTALRTKILFDFADDIDHRPLPIKTFSVTNEVFLTSDRGDLDFTFLSVAPMGDRAERLSDFGQFVLLEDSGKGKKGEDVSIIQHPDAGPKKIALRDSKIIGVKDQYIYYTTDTKQGSSGGTVLNDEWLPVALHHRAIKDPENPGKYIANRGIRISAIYAQVREQADAGDDMAQKVLALIEAEPPAYSGALQYVPAAPLNNRLPDLDTMAKAEHSEEAFRPDRWSNIEGYDVGFLSESFPLPLPPENQNVRMHGDRPDLPYTHFSVVMHETRKLPMLTACNVDGRQAIKVKHKRTWRFDPRLPRTAQTGNDVYVNNAYDRGHMVRRLSPMWGDEETALRAQDDTNHYTNCAPQHANLNQRVWLDLEDYLLDWAKDHKARVSIFTGPVFHPDDPIYRGKVRIPAEYWKVAVADDHGVVRAVGYRHTQKNLMATVEEAFGDYKTRRVPIAMIAEITGLDFNAYLPFDVAEGDGFESGGGIHPVDGPDDLGF